MFLVFVTTFFKLNLHFIHQLQGDVPSFLGIEFLHLKIFDSGSREYCHWGLLIISFNSNFAGGAL